MKVKRSRHILLTQLIAFGLLMAASPFAFGQTSTLIPPDQSFAGKTYGQLSAEWWQWAAAIPDPQSPLTDQTGSRCGVKQSGEIWFLAGTTGGSATRSCTVPAQKAIFFPIINAECSSVEGAGTTDQDLRACATDLIDRVKVAEASVDGVALPINRDFRVQSPPPPFPIRFVGNNPFGVPAGNGVAVSDGFWVLLGPLPAGQPHTVHFHGLARFPGGSTFEIDVTYHLEVAA